MVPTKRTTNNMFLTLNIITPKPTTPQVEYIINEEGAIAVVIRNWLTAEHAQDLHNRLTKEVPWIQGQMNMFGKTIDIPRTMFFLGDDHIKTYSYSRLTFPVQPWSNNTDLYKEIEKIRERICNDTTLQRITGVALQYDSCLLNFYRNGHDKIDPHSDREALGPMNAVVTISLGGTRKFVFKSVTKGANGRYLKIETNLNNGDLVLMAGRCQELWTHSIPRQDTDNARISLTYRLIHG